jgi:Protein of unknown function (DUF3137)
VVKAPFDEATAKALENSLAPTLRELSAVRADVIKKVKARSVTRVPLGVAGAFLWWVILQSTADAPDFFDLILLCGLGALLGYGWAMAKLDRDFKRLYKDRVLPQLAARFGDLTYQHAASARVDALRAHRIFRDFTEASADDEIVGSYRGLPVSIVEVRLAGASANEPSAVFDGLLIEVVLPRNLAGTTAVVADEGLLGNLKARLQSDSLQHVRLEDPRFAERYQVYSTDQIEARALLTPAFITRFAALAEMSGFWLPGALAEGNSFVVALPKRSSVDLFEPPSYWESEVTTGKTLLALSEDIKAVLEMADAVIDLDFWAKAPRPSAGP